MQHGVGAAARATPRLRRSADPLRHCRISRITLGAAGRPIQHGVGAAARASATPRLWRSVESFAHAFVTGRRTTRLGSTAIAKPKNRCSHICPPQHVRDMAQLRPPCFVAGSALVSAQCSLSVETTYQMTWRVACHVSIVLRVLNRTAAVAAKGNGDRSHSARARNGADATPLLRCRVSRIINPIMRQTWKRLCVRGLHGGCTV